MHCPQLLEVSAEYEMKEVADKFAKALMLLLQENEDDFLHDVLNIKHRVQYRICYKN